MSELLHTYTPGFRKRGIPQIPEIKIAMLLNKSNINRGILGAFTLPFGRPLGLESRQTMAVHYPIVGQFTDVYWIVGPVSHSLDLKSCQILNTPIPMKESELIVGWDFYYFASFDASKSTHENT